MSLNVNEIVIEEGDDFNVDGWKVCSFWDEDCDGMEFMNYEVAYWRGGSIDWASTNNCLKYFDCIDKALDYYEDINVGVV